MKFKKANILRRFTFQFLFGLSLFSFLQCSPSRAKEMPIVQQVVEQKEEIVIPEEPPINYHLVATPDTGDWLSSLTGDTLNALKVINRADGWRLKHIDTLVFPDTIGPDINLYAPFPEHAEVLEGVKKVLFVSHYVQAFAVYENGKRIKWGPVNLGRKYKPTPTGLFAVNWKSKRTTSTVNSSWILDWYCNIDNFEGIGMHQYALPGYPASHGCVRLYREDSEWLYHWASQWKLKDGKIDIHGTPVVIFGEYPHGGQKPWITHSNEENGLIISKEEFDTVVDKYLPTIMERQIKRDSVEMSQILVDQIQ